MRCGRVWQNESTMGHAYVTDLELEVPVGHDSGILGEFMHAVVNQGQDVSAAIRITVEARNLCTRPAGCAP